MDSPTISLLISAVALAVSILSFVTSEHSKRAARAIEIEQVRGEIALRLLQWEVSMRSILSKYQSLADRGYADIPQIQSRIRDVITFLARVAQQRAKLSPGIAKGTARQHLRITELKNVITEYEHLFEGLKADAREIEGVITEFEEA